ncbi:uncharacterized protein Bfra_006673 [Botrytis fragariae]|uniref:Uncharacterized protein n=1 Tax=Botrytis fragariae TaxID=1964551 RepID=A0A8H6EPI7_9HELO|nr:uncharacterized protein Bfra_006673 [Botrytis fragariae]KAF5879465.1 hypothetical protein Bfra_006673 [Botrytis fragariae]
METLEAEISAMEPQRDNLLTLPNAHLTDPAVRSANLAGRYQLACCSFKSYSIQIVWTEISADIRCLCCTITLAIGNIQEAFAG